MLRAPLRSLVSSVGTDTASPTRPHSPSTPSPDPPPRFHPVFVFSPSRSSVTRHLYLYLSFFPSLPLSAIPRRHSIQPLSPEPFHPLLVYSPRGCSPRGHLASSVSPVVPPARLLSDSFHPISPGLYTLASGHGPGLGLYGSLTRNFLYNLPCRENAFLLQIFSSSPRDFQTLKANRALADGFIDRDRDRDA